MPANRRAAAAAAPLFRRVIDNTVTGRQQCVVVTPRHDIELSGCDGPLTPVQAAAARTLIDEALAVIAAREGGGPVDALVAQKRGACANG